jgi:DNA-directed RNA polymerase subunit RPC12/RpoP
MMLDEKFHCLRCGYKYEAAFSKDQWPAELSCPKCKSNSVRWLKERRKKEAAKENK